MKNIFLFFLNKFQLNSSNAFEHKIFRWDSKDIDCIHQNEPSVRFVQDQLAKRGESIDAIFYFESDFVRERLPNKQTSHEEFFKTLRMKNGEAFEEKTFHPMHFQFPKTSEENISMILQMTNEIRTFKENLPSSSNNVRLHVDLTNCNASILLAIAQILNYSGFSIGWTVYSNFETVRVDNVSEVYKLFNLFAGVNEFINFCDVRSIEKYFENRKTSPELQRLLEKIKAFDNSIAICGTAQMESLASELREAMMDFAFIEQKTLQERIFLNLLEIFETEYRDILKDDLSRLDIIHYCARKNFLQQAMTLCTEWLPIYFVQKKFCYPQNPEIQRIVEPMHSRWEQTFIVSFSGTVSRFSPTQQLKPTETAKNFKAALFDMITNGARFTAEKIGIVNQKVDETFKALDRSDQVLQSVRGYSSPKMGLQKIDQDVFKLAELAFKKYNAPQGMSFDDFLTKKAAQKTLARGLQMSSDAAIIQMFEFNNPKKTQIAGKTEEQSEKIQWLNFFKAKGVLSDFDYSIEKLADVLKKYSAIREQRNLMNHASEKATMTNGQIRQMIIDCLESIKELEKIPDGAFINHTSLPNKTWSNAKLDAAKKFGDVYDVLFPTINPDWDEEKISKIAALHADKIAKLKPSAVLCQGEDLSYVFAIVSELKSRGILVLFAAGGANFKQFRSYETLPNE